MRPKWTTVYHVWEPRIWAPKPIRVTKKIVEQTQIVSSPFIYRNNQYFNENQQQQQQQQKPG